MTQRQKRRRRPVTISEQVLWYLRRAEPRGRQVKCWICHRLFANGWSWLHHFEIEWGDHLVCGASSLLGAWGYLKNRSEIWRKIR